MRVFRWRPLAVIGAAAALIASASGCGSPSITGAGLQRDFGPNFAQLYLIQQQLIGHPDAVADAGMHTAICTRGGPETPDRGAGTNWSCQVYWPSGPGGQTQTLSYEVDVKPTGCYTAQGPASLVGQQTIRAVDGRMVTNPLFEFYGCLDVG
ncbi:hypothetical protein [Rugosimonospora africana]|uniref:Secreted protein n=1 Tax=Rugosimonospora africana TaxID=556532 RepID=A0A8J3QQH2_9ACTN|nr:hypothetical protein [Rugosimonospora africana]GIH15063.1 hypothetical protein Raf01_32350 [Rugosimonospora africana]